MVNIRQATHQMILDIVDSTYLPFTQDDLEWIAENIEKVLQQRYHVKVEDIIIKDIK